MRWFYEFFNCSKRGKLLLVNMFFYYRSGSIYYNFCKRRFFKINGFFENMDVSY